MLRPFRSLSFRPAGADPSDGRYVAFGSWHDHLVPGDGNGSHDVLRYDRVTGEMLRASLNDADAEFPWGGFAGPMSADGGSSPAPGGPCPSAMPPSWAT